VALAWHPHANAFSDCVFAIIFDGTVLPFGEPLVSELVWEMSGVEGKLAPDLLREKRTTAVAGAPTGEEARQFLKQLGDQSEA
jgi:hypothetical protein